MDIYLPEVDPNWMKEFWVSEIMTLRSYKALRNLQRNYHQPQILEVAAHRLPPQGLYLERRYWHPIVGCTNLLGTAMVRINLLVFCCCCCWISWLLEVKGLKEVLCFSIFCLVFGVIIPNGCLSWVNLDFDYLDN